ncbi:hypothetical protein D3C78_1252950 [compost metagenome]
MRVFITEVCRSAVTTSRLATALAIASSSLFRPRRTRRLRTSTSSPTMFMISSSRAVSTRTVVSASWAGLLSAAGRAASAAGMDFSTTLFAAGWAATVAAGEPTNLPLPCSWSSSASNSSSLMLSSCAAGVAATAATGLASTEPVNLPLPCSWSSSDSNSSSLIWSSATGWAAGCGSGWAAVLAGALPNLPLPCNWSSSASNSSSLISSPSALAGWATATTGAACSAGGSRALSNSSNSASVMSA